MFGVYNKGEFELFFINAERNTNDQKYYQFHWWQEGVWNSVIDTSKEFWKEMVPLSYQGGNCIMAGIKPKEPTVVSIMPHECEM